VRRRGIHRAGAEGGFGEKGGAPPRKGERIDPTGASLSPARTTSPPPAKMPEFRRSPEHNGPWVGLRMSNSVLTFRALASVNE
jgi:hypothetical protein